MSNTDIWVALIGLLSTLIAAGRWLLQVIHKNKMREIREREAQAKRVEDLRDTNAKLFSDGVSAKLKLLENIVEGLKVQIVGLRVSIDKVVSEYGKIDSFTASMKNFIMSKENRVAYLESEVKRISADLILIRGKKNGTGTEN